MRICRTTSIDQFESMLQDYQKDTKWTKITPGEGDVEISRDISGAKKMISIIVYGILRVLTLNSNRRFRTDYINAKNGKEVVQLTCSDDKVKAYIAKIFIRKDAGSSDIQKEQKPGSERRTKPEKEPKLPSGENTEPTKPALQPSLTPQQSSDLPLTAPPQTMPPSQLPQPKTLTSKEQELEDKLQSGTVLTDESIEGIDFSKMRNMGPEQFELIFGTHVPSPKVEERIKNLKGTNLNILVKFFREEHVKFLSSEQISEIDFTKDLFEAFFPNRWEPLSSERISHLNKLKEKKLNVLVKFFNQGHAKALKPEQVAEMDFAEVLKGMERLDSWSLFWVFFGGGGDGLPLTEEEKGRLNQLNKKNLNALVEFFGPEHANALHLEKIEEIDFTELLKDISRDRTNSLFERLFGVGGDSQASLSKEQIDRLHHLKGKNLKVLVQFFDRSHVNALTPEQIGEITLTDILDALKNIPSEKEVSRDKVFRGFFGTGYQPLSVEEEKRLNDLKAEDILKLVEFFRRGHCRAIKQVSEIDFGKIFEAAPTRKQDIFSNFFGSGGDNLTDQDKDRLKQLKKNQLQVLSPFFRLNHFDVFDAETMAAIDFKIVIDGDQYKFDSLFILPHMDEEQREANKALLQKVLDADNLMALVPYFEKTHWKCLLKEQCQLILPNQKQLTAGQRGLLNRHMEWHKWI